MEPLYDSWDHPVVNNVFFMWIAKNNCRWGMFYQVWLRSIILPQLSIDQRRERTKTPGPTGSTAVKLEVWNTPTHAQFSFQASVGWSLKMWNSNHVVCWFWSCVWNQIMDTWWVLCCVIIIAQNLVNNPAVSWTNWLKMFLSEKTQIYQQLINVWDIVFIVACY